MPGRAYREPSNKARDLDGETTAYSTLADETGAILSREAFPSPLDHRQPAYDLHQDDASTHAVGDIIAAANLHCLVWSSISPAQARTYLAGSELLDSQYDEYSADIFKEDLRHYFKPIALTDATGGPADWLKPYVPQSGKKLRPILSDARKAVSAHVLARTKGEIAARHELHQKVMESAMPTDTALFG